MHIRKKQRSESTTVHMATTANENQKKKNALRVYEQHMAQQSLLDDETDVKNSTHKQALMQLSGVSKNTHDSTRYAVHELKRRHDLTQKLRTTFYVYHPGWPLYLLRKRDPTDWAKIESIVAAGGANPSGIPLLAKYLFDLSERKVPGSRQDHLRRIRLFIGTRKQHLASLEEYYNGHSPLQQAIVLKDMEIVRVLIDAGARVGKYDLETAATHPSTEILKLIIKKGHFDSQTLSKAVYEASNSRLKNNPSAEDNVHALLDAGADVQAVDIGGFIMPEDGFISSEWVFVVERLLRRGANPNGPSHIRSDTPLMLASDYANVPMMQLLISKKADVNASIPGDGRKTAMNRAAGSCSRAAVETLLEAGGILVTESDDYHEFVTPLYDAIVNNCVDMVRFLLSRNVSRYVGYEHILEFTKVDNDDIFQMLVYDLPPRRVLENLIHYAMHHDQIQRLHWLLAARRRLPRTVTKSGP